MRSTVEPALLTTSEMLKILPVSRRTLLRWRSRGTGPSFVKIEGRVFYPWPNATLSR